MLGAVDTEVFSKLIRGIINGDVVGSLHILDDMIMQGRELGQFVNDFIWYMRNLLLVQTSDNVEDVIDASADRIQALKEEAQMVETEVLMRYIRVFSDLSNQIKYSSQKRVLIEIALIKLNKPAMDTDVSSLLNRMALIENKLENGVVGQKRYDLIVSHFETDGVNEKHEIKVISGEGETIPQYTNSDTFNGGTVSEMPLYLVEIDGISIKSIKSQFDIIPNLQELIDKMVIYKE